MQTPNSKAFWKGYLFGVIAGLMVGALIAFASISGNYIVLMVGAGGLWALPYIFRRQHPD